MNKVYYTNTWGYDNFITEHERQVLLDYAYSLKLTPNGFGRAYAHHVSNLNPPKEFFDIKNRIINIEKLENFEYDSIFGDFIGINTEGGAIHPHTDPNHPDKIHTRFNLLLSIPEKGGKPIYNNNVIDVKEKTLWRCEAGLYTHASSPVEGSKHRVNISFGFQLSGV
jgi:hypothetical protein